MKPIAVEIAATKKGWGRERMGGAEMREKRGNGDGRWAGIVE